eukprot:TRINITY_DN11691_c0_g2_i1.p2 TRINITY_DN11691_c0_g2~~TRINITY_DN11691_c0_g2_i1.p2  ORF type:complete len:294 (+),score=121.85 TRINITY_DN11691_c0_g2_i1:182-1063(+)
MSSWSKGWQDYDSKRNDNDRSEPKWCFSAYYREKAKREELERQQEKADKEASNKQMVEAMCSAAANAVRAALPMGSKDRDATPKQQQTQEAALDEHYSNDKKGTKDSGKYEGFANKVARMLCRKDTSDPPTPARRTPSNDERLTSRLLRHLQASKDKKKKKNKKSTSSSTSRSSTSSSSTKKKKKKHTKKLKKGKTDKKNSKKQKKKTKKKTKASSESEDEGEEEDGDDLDDVPVLPVRNRGRGRGQGARTAPKAKSASSRSTTQKRNKAEEKIETAQDSTGMQTSKRGKKKD